MKKTKYFSSVFIFILLSAIIYLYGHIGYFEQKVQENIRQVIFHNTSHFLENIDSLIRNEVDGNLYQVLREDPSLREDIEEHIGLLATSTFKYVYVLYRDKEGKYRYLLDGSKEEKGEFDSKFDVNIKEWDKVYQTKKSHVVFQDNLTDLWVTTLYPYIQNGEVKAVMAIDFSTTLFVYLSKIIQPLKDIFLYVFIAIAILIVLLIYQLLIQKKIRKESFIDPLTHAYNRLFLRDFVETIDFENYDLALFDLDYFKRINDTYGHKAGDYILESFVKVVNRHIKANDVLIRFGGEEFLLFIHKKKRDASQAFDMVSEIKTYIASYPFTYENYKINLTVSVGIVMHMQKYKNIHDVIKRADERLYLAKFQGRNRIVDGEEKETCNVVRRCTLEEVKYAIDDNRIRCHFQPIVLLGKQHRIVKYEALVRLLDEEGVIIYPSSFLDVISGTNISMDLTKKLLELVFKKIEETQTPISINLNASDIMDHSIYPILIEQLRTYGKLSNYLTVELLEYENIDNEVSQVLADRLQIFRSMGVQIALDDFGSGYSNFAIFEKLPINILKIDGSLIKNIDRSETSYHIVKAIVMLAKNLNIEVVAEFIHNKKVLERVKELEVTYGQGFYLGKPSEEIL